jgi:hypothetical protein
MKNLLLIDNEFSSLDYAKVLCNSGNYKDALLTLERIGRSDSLGKKYALTGLVHYLSEDYGKAVSHYERALSYDPHNEEWSDLLSRSKANLKAKAHIMVPEFKTFDREELLDYSNEQNGNLPQPILSKTNKSLKLLAKSRLESAIGKFGDVLMYNVSMLVGKLTGYRNELWTNWYNKPKLLAILTLGYMRRKLNKNNLIDTYPVGALTGFAPANLIAPEGVSHFRTANGMWNNLENPMEGAAGTRFTRNVSSEAISEELSKPLMTPNPRVISNVLLTRKNKEVKEIPFLNMLAASWIQFQTHGWVSHGEIPLEDVYEVPFPEGDPAIKKFWQTKMFVGKTQADPTRDESKETTPLTFINEVSHWWDGSQLYGSDQKTVDHLRSGSMGKLRLENDNNLPLDKKGMEEAGFTRNWWVGLSMFHTLFAKEHNAICDKLASQYPEWDDNRLFNVARLINAALMAKIHSVEWTPAILPNQVLTEGLNTNWYGLLAAKLKKPKDRKTIANFNIKNSELGGIVGNPINKHNAAYSLSEEFVEVYRLHSLLPETLKIRTVEAPLDYSEIHMTETRQAASAKLTREKDMSDLFFSFGVQHPGQLTLNNYPEFMQSLSIPGNPVYDLGAVDILRARERGIPRYNDFRRELGLIPIQSFDELTDDAEVLENLKKVYGTEKDAVEQLDLLIGTLAETQRPTNFGFGETLFQIFLLTASRRLQGDRFYTDSFNEEVYTREGLEWIDDNDLKSVLLRHYPELKNTGLSNIKNAFEPWDTGEILDPKRHPLRAFDKDLDKDKWLGDSYRNN